MKVLHSRQGVPSEIKAETFTGLVLNDAVMPTTDGVMINNVVFTPGARTYWHTHEIGQVLVVLAGRGWVCVDGGTPEPLEAGDTVWIPKDEKHWHGAAADSYMIHTAISIGKTRWMEEVADTQYPAA